MNHGLEVVFEVRINFQKGNLTERIDYGRVHVKCRVCMYFVLAVQPPKCVNLYFVAPFGPLQYYVSVCLDATPPCIYTYVYETKSLCIHVRYSGHKWHRGYMRTARISMSLTIFYVNCLYFDGHMSKLLTLIKIHAHTMYPKLVVQPEQSNQSKVSLCALFIEFVFSIYHVI